MDISGMIGDPHGYSEKPVLEQHVGLLAHDGYAEHSHEVRPDHLGVQLEVPGYESDPDLYEARSDFVNEISGAVVKALGRGVSREKMLADFEAALSIL